MISSFLRDIYCFFLYLFAYIVIINLLFLFLHVMLRFKIKMVRIPSMKKLYITDLDGTLLNQNASISPYSEQVIKKIIKQGIHFTIATGRSPIRIFSILQNIPLKLPVILMNGAAIYDIENQKCLSTVPICKTSFHRILDTEQKANIRGGYILTQNNQLNGIITVSPTLLLQTYLKTSDLTLIHSNLELKDEETLLYALYMDSSNQKLQFMYDTLKHDSNIICDFYKDVYQQNCWCLEITSSQATKYSAIQFLRTYGSYDYVTGFGDSWNDISLFQACDESYAVANASSKLKAIATATIKSNIEDGVADFLSKLLK